MKMNFLLIIIGLIVGCHKRESVIPPVNPCSIRSCDTSKLDLVWLTPLSHDTAEWVSVKPLYYSGNVLFTRSTFDQGIDTLKLLDAKTGKVKWRWAEYYNDGGIPNLKIFRQSNKLLFTTWSDVYCVDALSGKSIWQMSHYKVDLCHLYQRKLE